MKPATLALAIAAAWGIASPAFAQPQIGSYTRPQTNSRPAVSPYLNLGRSNNPAIDYFGIVRPEMQTQQTLQSLQQGLQQVQGETTAPPGDSQTQLGSGHSVSFFNYSHYYPTGGSRFAGGSSGIVVGPALGATNRR